MRTFKKAPFDIASALAGKWQQHPNPDYFKHRLQLRVENTHWKARLTNPKRTEPGEAHYLPGANGVSLKMHGHYLTADDGIDAVMDAAKTLCDTILHPTTLGPTFGKLWDDHAAAGYECKAGKGQVFGPRAAKAQKECERLMAKVMATLSPIEMASEHWEEHLTALRSTVGVDDYRKITGYVRAFFEWAKRVKKVKVGDKPSRGVDPRNKRPAFDSLDEVERIIRFIERQGDLWLALHCRFLLHVGCRPGDEIEVAAIRFRDVATAVNGSGWVEVRITNPKPHTPRRIAYADRALLGVMAAIRNIHPDATNPDARVFPAAEYGRRFKEALRALDAEEPHYGWLAGENAGRCLYSFRHFHASERAADEGRWNADNLSKHLGNTPEVCRAYYIAWNERRIAASMPMAAE